MKHRGFRTEHLLLLIRCAYQTFRKQRFAITALQKVQILFKDLWADLYTDTCLVFCWTSTLRPYTFFLLLCLVSNSAFPTIHVYAWRFSSQQDETRGTTAILLWLHLSFVRNLNWRLSFFCRLVLAANGSFVFLSTRSSHDSVAESSFHWLTSSSTSAFFKQAGSWIGRCSKTLHFFSFWYIQNVPQRSNFLQLQIPDTSWAFNSVEALSVGMLHMFSRVTPTYGISSAGSSSLVGSLPPVYQTPLNHETVMSARHVKVYICS